MLTAFMLWRDRYTRPAHAFCSERTGDHRRDRTLLEHRGHQADSRRQHRRRPHCAATLLPIRSACDRRTSTAHKHLRSDSAQSSEVVVETILGLAAACFLCVRISRTLRVAGASATCRARFRIASWHVHCLRLDWPADACCESKHRWQSECARSVPETTPERNEPTALVARSQCGRFTATAQAL